MKVWEIIRLIEESPVKAVDGDDLDTVFETPDVTRFSVFFDGGEPDYINWLDPRGDQNERIDFWPESKDDRARSALAYLAGNLLHLPHVNVRLKQAQAWFLHGHDY